MSRNKQKGTSFERLIADGLADALQDDRIDRAPSHGAKDRGDIAGVRSPFGKVAIEVKNVARLDLAGWVDEAATERGNLDAVAGVVIHKRRGKGTVAQWQDALGIDWTSDRRELAEAIPPMYTEFIGAQLIRELEVAA